MSDHAAACRNSASLCDKLFEHLSNQISFLQRAETGKWCGLYQKGRKRFAYINHRKRSNRLEVWCLGDYQALVETSSLTIHLRQPTTGGFGSQFQARFFVDSAEDVANASELLYNISYPQS